MDQEKWINEVLESTKTMHRAEPSPFLFEQVIAKVRSGTHQMEHSAQGSSMLRWGLAVVVSAIIMLNLGFIVKSNLSKSSETNELSLEKGTSLNNATIYTY